MILMNNLRGLKQAYDIKDVSGTWLLPAILGSETVRIASVGDEIHHTGPHTLISV